MNEYLSYRELILKQEDIVNYKHKCKCGHIVVIANKKGMTICNHCGNLVFKNKKIEFEHRMKENLIKVKRFKENV